VRSLGGRTVDLLVIGGGIVGAGIARDAALRGLSVALVEQNDLASGTSSRPTRLIHGGLRYLELFDFGLVRSDMRERETLLRIAPHLVFPLAFLLPLYRPTPFYRLKLRIGMFLYDLLSLDKSLPKRRRLGRADTLAAEPNLDPDGLSGAWRFYDAQVPFVERLVVENAVDAAAHGAFVLNHARATGYVRDADGRRVVGARVHDQIGGADLEIRARYTVNATGPWLDETVSSLRKQPKPLLRLTKGTHLVIPRATEQAHVLFAKRDGRLFFVLPWNGYTMVGTTDTDYAGDPADAEASADDVEYLRSEAARAFPRASLDRIHFTWAGVRALVRVEGVSEGEVSRKHALLDHDRADGVPGVLSVIGGKITAYRLIAAEVTDLVAKRIGSRQPSTTAQRLLPGAGGAPQRALELIVSGDPSLAAPVCEHVATTGAEIVRAIRDEWAVTIGDVLLRRTGIGLAACQGLDRLDAIADLIAHVARWDAPRRAAEIAAYRREIAPMRKFATA
jgi:glycerol-3-phosphate dehydrogenase